MNWGDYIVYVDESGDHSLTSIDHSYPVFVLACCIFKKEIYSKLVVPKFEQFKMKHWGHDIIILHEREIREKQNVFSFLFNRERHAVFMQQLNALIEEAPLTIIAVVIDKIALKNKHKLPENPYEIALKFCLEKLWLFLLENNQEEKITHFVVERRGRKEDSELELAFQQISNIENSHKRVLPIRLVFAKKECNSVGLQLADLFARPIGRHQLNLFQTNRAYCLIQPKFYQNTMGEIEGYGMQLFPERSESLAGNPARHNADRELPIHLI